MIMPQLPLMNFYNNLLYNENEFYINNIRFIFYIR